MSWKVYGKIGFRSRFNGFCALWKAFSISCDIG
jgi:hypothetical protein